MDITEKEIQIKEQRGLWKAEAHINRIAKRFLKNNRPLGIRHILEAHRILFLNTNEIEFAGKYRENDPKIIRIDNTQLKISHWTLVSSRMAVLDEELKTKTANLKYPTTKNDYIEIIDLAARASHNLVCIHPFHNGNGRMSRLLINFILRRADLSSIAIKPDSTESPKEEDKRKYLMAMLQADKGDFSLLHSLIIRGLVYNMNKRIKIQEESNLPKFNQKKLIPYKRDFY